MAYFKNSEFVDAANVLDIVAQERTKCLSVREWKHRLAGYGYNITETDAGYIVTSLATNKELVVVPEAFILQAQSNARAERAYG
jgi:hypothetical protein